MPAYLQNRELVLDVFLTVELSRSYDGASMFLVVLGLTPYPLTKERYKITMNLFTVRSMLCNIRVCRVGAFQWHEPFLGCSFVEGVPATRERGVCQASHT